MTSPSRQSRNFYSGSKLGTQLSNFMEFLHTFYFYFYFYHYISPIFLVYSTIYSIRIQAKLLCKICKKLNLLRATK